MKLKMKAQILILALFLTLIQHTCPQSFYKKVIHNTDPQAKCLDGSPSMFYIHQGSQKDKFLLYFVGGGYCGETTLAATLQNCYKRSKTELGTSTKWPQFFTDSMGAEGVLSLNQPIYKNWTKVIFVYCDGAMHTGGSDAPIQYKDTQLYFRGNRIVRAHFKYLITKYKMDYASKIILTGGSAGGIASFMWGNYLQSIVKNPQSVYVIPDSGIFIRSNTFNTNQPIVQQQIATLMQIAYKSQQTPISQCNSQYPGQQYKCTFVQINHKYLKGKYLWINSQYDQWAISNMLNIKCLIKGQSGQTPKNCSPEEMVAIHDYRNRYVKFVQENLQTRQNWSMWSIACSQHVYQPFKGFYDSDKQRVPMKTGMTVKDAMVKFVFENKVLWTMDTQQWPSNQPCAY